MKIDITFLVLLLFIVLFIGRTKITMNPFSIQIHDWRTLIGIVLIFIGIELICMDRTKELLQLWQQEKSK